MEGSETVCRGSEASPHEAVQVLLPPSGEAACPLCRRLYRRRGLEGRVLPAVWPED